MKGIATKKISIEFMKFPSIVAIFKKKEKNNVNELKKATNKTFR